MHVTNIHRRDPLYQHPLRRWPLPASFGGFGPFGYELRCGRWPIGWRGCTHNLIFSALFHHNITGDNTMNRFIDRRTPLGCGAAGCRRSPAPAWAQAKPTLRFAAVFSDKDIRADMMKMFAKRH